MVDIDGMYCGHPYFEDLESWSNRIISQSDRGKIPFFCPLRKDTLTTTHKISLR
jgi:hypothetical protein